MAMIYLSPSRAFPCIGGPGKVKQEDTFSGETKNRAFRRHVAANSRVGAGIAADWEWPSKLKPHRSKHSQHAKLVNTCLCTNDSQ